MQTKSIQVHLVAEDALRFLSTEVLCNDSLEKRIHLTKSAFPDAVYHYRCTHKSSEGLIERKQDWSGVLKALVVAAS